MWLFEELNNIVAPFCRTDEDGLLHPEIVASERGRESEELLLKFGRFATSQQ